MSSATAPPFPSLGYAALDWIYDNLAQPDQQDYTPFTPTPDQANFLINLLRTDAMGRSLVYRRAVYSRPKGAGKSPWMAALAILFALGDVVPDGLDAHGNPVGRPLNTVRTPLIQLAAVSEDQGANMFVPALEMLRNGPVLDNYPGVDPMETFIGLPGAGPFKGTGRIEAVTASATSREGNRPFFVVMDQVESWTRANGGDKLARALRRNAAKVGGITVETPNAFIPGTDSVAEQTAAYYEKLREKNIAPMREGLLYDHIEAPADTDITDEASLRAGLEHVYRYAPWVNLDRFVAESRDPNVSTEEYRRYYLNQVSAASDSWISRPEWEACRDDAAALEPGDAIVLGFDGSRGRVRGKADATALVALRISDKLAVPIHIWEQPDNVDEWQPDVQDVNDTVRHTFDTYRVVGMYADPSGWQEHVARWEAAYGRRLQVKASRNAPMSLWPRGKGREVSAALKLFHEALLNKEVKHNGHPVLTRHVLNARRRAKSRQGYLIYKEHPDSVNKIDGAYALVTAYKCLLDAVQAGAGKRKRNQSRIRVFS